MNVLLMVISLCLCCFKEQQLTLFSPYYSMAEVIRTRLREEGSRYRSFFQTLLTVPREEGYRALYRGLTTHLVRQIPNTAIMMCTYEVVVYLLGR